MQANVYNQEGKESRKITLPSAIFEAKWKPDLVHQGVSSMLSNSRAGTADTKGRSEVRGGGKKPWKQKGTGRARHGSIRSPIWRGGGATHGPLAEKNYKKKINKKMRTTALFSALSRKLKDSEVFFVEKIDLAKGKTKEATSVAASFSKIPGVSRTLGKKEGNILLATFSNDPKVFKSFRNISSVRVENIRNLNPVLLLNSKYVLISEPEESLAILSTKTKKADVAAK